MNKQFHSWIYIFRKDKNSNPKRYIHSDDDSTVYYSKDIESIQVPVDR